jgi:molybdopterin converting factor small subunit
MARIIIPTPLRKFTSNTASIPVEGLTVLDAIKHLSTQFPGLARYLLNADESLKGFVRIYLGDNDIKQLNGGKTEISSEDTISIIPAIAGG